jgi:hypothetical protein
METTTTTAPSTDQHRDAFFAARGTMQEIETLWELATFADRPFDGDLEDLSPTAARFAESEGWDLAGATRDSISEAVTEYARELPLSVLVRSDWHTPGSEFEPAQFELLLSTGGPAVRVLGELDSYREPYRPQLQYQDWGIPWTDHPESNVDALLWFAGLFFYGD